MTHLLDITDLHIEARSGDTWHEIVKGVDLTLDRGEIVGLIGESGAGKSTLGLAAMGYVKPGCRITGGSIRFDGQELVGAPPAACATCAAAGSPMWRKARRPRSTRPGG